MAALPPRPIIRLAWKAHKALVGVSGGRFGYRSASEDQEGLAELITIGRKSGERRAVMIAFFEDGDDFVTMAMNGWDKADPAWWLNLQANPEAELALSADRTVKVTGRAAAEGKEHDRLWENWRRLDHSVDKFADRRTNGTPVVILSPVESKA